MGSGGGRTCADPITTHLTLGLLSPGIRPILVLVLSAPAPGAQQGFFGEPAFDASTFTKIFPQVPLIGMCTCIE